MMEQIVLVDLCCKAGGCSRGYEMAAQKLGIDIHIVGVDIDDQPNYPYEFIQDDAVSFFEKNKSHFTHAHASPPCQKYSTSTVEYRKKGKQYHDNLPAVRASFERAGLPSVIENVMPAPMRGDIVLRGDMFGLQVLRKRKFELINWFALNPVMPPQYGSVKNGDYAQVLGKGQLKVTGGKRFKVPGDNVTQVWSNAMGIDWMTKEELREAIPPLYTQYIGLQLFTLKTQI